MREIKKGDIVSRHSYGHDIIFSVKRIIKLANKKEIAILKGIDVRVEADAPIDDLKILTKEEQKRRERELEERIIQKIQKETIYKENRRKHPLAQDGRIIDGINFEREKLKEIKKQASYINRG
jgi:spore coat assembly protein